MTSKKLPSLWVVTSVVVVRSANQFQLRTAYMGIAMMGVMHIYFKFTQPLFVQSLMTFKNVYDSKLVQIYIFGKEGKDELQRPFKSPSLFGGTNNQILFLCMLTY